MSFVQQKSVMCLITSWTETSIAGQVPEPGIVCKDTGQSVSICGTGQDLSCEAGTEAAIWTREAEDTRAGSVGSGCLVETQPCSRNIQRKASDKITLPALCSVFYV